MTSTTDAQHAADATVAAVNSSTSAADALAHHVATTSPNHKELTGDKRAARDAAYDDARASFAEFRPDAVREVLDSYTTVRAQLDTDSVEWWGLHGVILAARDELRAHAQQLRDVAAESEATDPAPSCYARD